MLVETSKAIREMVRHRAKLVAWRSGLKASVHGVLAKQGLHPQTPDLLALAAAIIAVIAARRGQDKAEARHPVGEGNHEPRELSVGVATGVRRGG